MSTSARRRLMRDFKKLQIDPPSGVCASPTENNILLWKAVIFGPPDTPFEDGTFKLIMEFTEEYPNAPPVVRFISQMFHPNIYTNGHICMDIFQNRWSPTYDVEGILTSIQSLLNDPNPDSPANSEAATLFKENRREYERRIQAIVQKSWEDVEEFNDSLATTQINDDDLISMQDDLRSDDFDDINNNSYRLFQFASNSANSNLNNSTNPNYHHRANEGQ